MKNVEHKTEGDNSLKYIFKNVLNCFLKKKETYPTCRVLILESRRTFN